MKDSDLVIHFQFLTEPTRVEMSWDFDVNVFQNVFHWRPGRFESINIRGAVGYIKPLNFAHRIRTAVWK